MNLSTGGNCEFLDEEDLKKQYVELASNYLSHSSFIEKLLFFPFFRRSFKVSPKEPLCEVSIKKFQQIKDRLINLRVSPLGCTLSIIFFLTVHILFTFRLSTSQNVGLSVASLIASALGLVCLVCVMSSYKLFKSSEIAVSLALLNLFLLLMLVVRVFNASDLTLLFKISLVRVGVFLPILPRNHFIIGTLKEGLGDLGLVLIAIFFSGKNSFASTSIDVYLETKEALTQNLVGLILYLVAFIMKNIVDWGTHFSNYRFVDVFGKIYELALLEHSIIKYLEGMPNVSLSATGVSQNSSMRSEKNKIVPLTAPYTPLHNHSDSNLHRNSTFTFKKHSFDNFSGRVEKLREEMEINLSKQKISLDLFFENTSLVSTTTTKFSEIKTDPNSSSIPSRFDSDVGVVKDRLKTSTNLSHSLTLTDFWAIISEGILCKYNCSIMAEDLQFNDPKGNATSQTLFICSIFSLLEKKRFISVRIKQEDKNSQSLTPVVEKELPFSKPECLSPLSLVNNKVALLQERKPKSRIQKPKKSIFSQGRNISKKELGEERYRNTLTPPKVIKKFEGSDFKIMKRKSTNMRPSAIHLGAQIGSEGKNSNESPSRISRMDDNFLDMVNLINGEDLQLDTPCEKNKSLISGCKLGDSSHSIQPFNPRQAEPEFEEVVSVVVHDMRNPLMCILGNLELITHEVESLPNYHLLHPLLRSSMTSAVLLESLVSDILDSARISKGIFKVNSSQFDLKECLEECMDTISIASKAKNDTVELEFKGTEIMNTDKQRLKQVVLNFLSNAIKFTQGGKIKIRASDCKNFKKISIEDTGKGMSSEEVAQMFDKFCSNRDKNSNNKGIGLGLFICKSILDKIGPQNQILVESVLNKGTKITFLIFQDFSEVDSDEPQTKSQYQELRLFKKVLLRSEYNNSEVSRSAGLPRTKKQKEEANDTIFDLNDQGVNESRRLIHMRLNNGLSKDFSSKRSFNDLQFKRGNILSNLRLGKSEVEEDEDLPKASIANELESKSNGELIHQSIDLEDQILFLIVDDDMLVLDLLVQFTERGCEELKKKVVIETASSFKDACEKLLCNSVPYNVIFTDLNLGDGTGTKLRSSVTKAYKDSIFVLLSGDDLESLEVHRPNFFQLFKKPTTYAKWLNLLKDCFNKIG